MFPYSGGAYQTPAGRPWQLTTSGSGINLVFSLTNILTGEVLKFNYQDKYLSDTDSYGNADTLSPAGLPTSDTNSGGRALTLAYTNGQLTDLKSPLYVSSGGSQGQHVSYGYGGCNLSAITLGAGTADAQTTTFGYSGSLLSSVTTPATHTWSLAYDNLGRLVSITSPISGTAGQAGYTPAYLTKFTYTSGQTVVAQGSGTTAEIDTTYVLDSSGQATTITDGLNHSRHFSYDADHDVQTSQDANSNTTTFHYQYIGPNTAYGLVSEIDYPAIHPLYPTNTLTAPTSYFVYDPSTHDLTERYDNYGAYSFYTYNGHHDVSTMAQLVSSSPGPVYHWRGQMNGYDTYGEQTSRIDGRGLTVPDTTSLSSGPSVTTNGQAASFTHSWTYTTQGDVQTSSTPPITTSACPGGTCAATTQYTYDGDGDQLTMQSANNYNAGNPTANATVYGYDHLGRQNSVKQPPLTIVNPPVGGPTTGQPLTTIEFDGDGNVNMQVDAGGDDSYYSYDPLGRLVSTQQPLTLRTQSDPKIAAQTALTIRVYTSTNLASVQDPQGNVTTYNYDAAGRPSNALNAAGQQTTYGYDNADNLTSVKVGNPANPSSTISYTYDALNEPTTQAVTGPGLGSALTTTSSYDLHGSLVRRQDPNNDTSFAGYDLADDLMSQELDPNAPNLPSGTNSESFSYDAAGNRVGSTDFRGGATQMTLDGDNRQTAQLDSYTGTTALSTTAGFDPDGNLASQLQTSGSQSHSFGATLNPADWPQQATNDGLTSSTTGSGVGDVLAQTIQNGAGTVSYNLDQAGRENEIGVLSMGSTPLTTTFSFNNNEQMTGMLLPNNVEQDAGYDQANRLTSLTATNNGNHALLNTTYQYGYDPLGLTNAITTTVQGSPSTQTLTHDAAGRLTAVSGGSNTGSWSYEGRGNLTSATVNGATTTYSYSANNPEEVASTSISGQPTSYYNYEGGWKHHQHHQLCQPAYPAFVRRADAIDTGDVGQSHHQHHHHGIQCIRPAGQLHRDPGGSGPAQPE